jgi:poly(A) polymerase-like protein
VIETLREALAGERAWLVGGALRDRLLGRPTPDLDVVVDGDVRRAARSLGRGAGGASFELSDQFGAWRVVARDRSWQVDITPLQGGSLEADLGARDLTVNAMAEPLGGGELVDPHGGARDLDHKRLRMVSAEAFVADPLRTLRVARLATELGFEIDPDTAAAVRRHAPGLAHTAQERVFTELRRIVEADAAVRGLTLMDELELVAASAIPPPRSATRRWPARSARCWPSRWPTSSRGAAVCASVRCCTTSPSRRPAPSCRTAVSAFPATTSRAPIWPARCWSACARASGCGRTWPPSLAITCAWASSSTRCHSIATSSTATC